MVEAGRPDGPAIVFIHGLASSSSAWTGLLGHQELARRFRLIAFDLRGHGQSATDLKPEQLTAEGPAAGARLWSQDLDAVLSGVESPILVGWSFGGGVVQSWLQTHRGPGSASAAVLLCVPNVFGPVPAGDAAGNLVTPATLGVLAGAAGDGRSFARLILADGPGDTSFCAELADQVTATAEATPAGTVAGALSYLNDFRPFLASMNDADRGRLTAVAAQGDQVFDHQAVSEVWAQVGVRTRSVPDAGHALSIRHPDRLARILLDIADS